MKQLKELARYTVVLFAVAIGLAGASSIFFPKRQAANALSPSAQCVADLQRIMGEEALKVPPEVEALAYKIRQMRLEKRPAPEIDLAESQLKFEQDSQQILRMQAYCAKWANCFPQKPYQNVFDECYRSMK